jgi:hydroxymethylglutaryl-CoA lyase
VKSVQIVEVGMRDGLQNESVVLGLQDKLEFFKRLEACGFKTIEAGSFVRPDLVPQMRDSNALITQLKQKRRKASIAALVPNEKGMHEAISAGVDEIAVFTAASDSFCKKNINCSIEESFERFRPVIKLAKKHKIKVRGYLSTAFACPFEGEIAVNKVVKVAQNLLVAGCYQVSIGDTIGVADPVRVEKLFKALNKKIPYSRLAGHFHDTRGTALANIYAAFRLGVRVFDSSLGGLGGCPYAPAATGNVATEDVVYMFERMNVKTGLNLKGLVELNRWLSSVMNKKLFSKVSLIN